MKQCGFSFYLMTCVIHINKGAWHPLTQHVMRLEISVEEMLGDWEQGWGILVPALNFHDVYANPRST